MYKLLNILPALLICVVLTVSCEDSDSIVSGVEPAIRVSFINADSLAKLNEQLEIINMDITDIDDSLAKIQMLIDSGDMTDYTNNQSSLNEQKSTLSKETTTISSIVMVITSGLVRVNAISSPDDKEPLLFTDSMTTYRLPLNSNSTFSNYSISLAGENYVLELNYNLDTLVKERKVIIEASEIKVTNHSFLDSTYIINDEKELTLYF